MASTLPLLPLPQNEQKERQMCDICVAVLHGCQATKVLYLSLSLPRFKREQILSTLPLMAAKRPEAAAPVVVVVSSGVSRIGRVGGTMCLYRYITLELVAALALHNPRRPPCLDLSHCGLTAKYRHNVRLVIRMCIKPHNFLGLRVFITVYTTPGDRTSTRKRGNEPVFAEVK